MNSILFGSSLATCKRLSLCLFDYRLCWHGKELWPRKDGHLRMQLFRGYYYDEPSASDRR